MVIGCEVIVREEVASGKTVLSEDATFGVETCLLGRRQAALYETRYIEEKRTRIAEQMGLDAFTAASVHRESFTISLTWNSMSFLGSDFHDDRPRLASLLPIPESFLENSLPFVPVVTFPFC